MIFFLLSVIFLVALYCFLFVSKVAALVIWGFFLVLCFVVYKKSHHHEKMKTILVSIIVSSIIIVAIKTLTLSGSEIVSYRVSNTFEHANLMFALSILSYAVSCAYIQGKKLTILFCIFFSFTVSTLLEIAQYVYREYLWIVAGKSYGLYHDSMVDLGVNFVSACVFCFIVVHFFERKYRIVKKGHLES